MGGGIPEIQLSMKMSPKIRPNLVPSLYFLQVLPHKLNKGAFCDKLLFQLLQKMNAGLTQ